VLTRLDRLQLAVLDRAAVARRLAVLLDAVPVDEDAVAPLAAKRTTVRAGAAVFELLAADGAGPVADHLAAAGQGLFGAGFAAPDLAPIRARLVEHRVAFAEAGAQLFLDAAATGGHGLRCVLSPLDDAGRRDGGLVTHLYEVTNLVGDHAVAAARYADLFALATDRYCPIESAEYGYRGVLTMFDPRDRLDRIECITPHDRAKTMGRFMTKHGPCLYMAFAEAPDLGPIRARLAEHAGRDWTPVQGPHHLDTIFVHPRALAGTMLGISRATVAWSWSGHPERVRQ
jgi:hypothetical protein